MECSVHVVQYVVLATYTFDLVRLYFSGDGFSSDGDLSLSGAMSNYKVLLRALNASTMRIESADLSFNAHSVVRTCVKVPNYDYF